MDKSIMKKLILALALLLAPSLAWAQCNGVYAAGQACGSVAGGIPGPVTQGSTLSAPPIVILATGQSNFTRTPTLAWVPSAGATLWNFNGVDGNVGTAYAAISPNTINVSWKFASDLAARYPAQRVCLINVSFAGQSISHWMIGTGAPDVFQNILNNITGALAACGATQIDMMLWWQGESDADAPTTYLTDFSTVITRFQALSWFPVTTPIVVYGIAPTAISTDAASDIFNGILQGVVNQTPDLRQYVYSGTLPASFWVDTLHLNGNGEFAAGAMSANEFLNGPGRKTIQNVVVNPVTGNVGVGTVQPDSPLTVNINTQNAVLPAPIAGTVEHGIGSTGVGGFYLLDSIAIQPAFIGRRFDGTLAAPTAVQSGEALVLLQGRGYDGTASAAAGNVSVQAAQNWVVGAHGSQMDFLTITNGGTTLLARQRVENDGGITIPPTVTGGSKGAGTVNVSGGFYVGGTAGLSVTKTVRASGGAADCNLVFTGGLLTSSTC